MGLRICLVPGLSLLKAFRAASGMQRSLEAHTELEVSGPACLSKFLFCFVF